MPLPHPFLTQQKDIELWLKSHNIKKYALIPDSVYGFVVDVHQNVEVPRKKLDLIPVKFNIINGHFYIEQNSLISLEGSPHTVTGNFDCTDNLLPNLKHSPRIINGNFSCAYNRLTSLVGGPVEVGRNYYCGKNKLKNLKGVPQVLEELDCSENLINSALYSPLKCDEMIYYFTPFAKKHFGPNLIAQRSEKVTFNFFQMHHLKESLEKNLVAQEATQNKPVYKI